MAEKHREWTYIGLGIAVAGLFIYKHYIEPSGQVVVVQREQRYVPCPTTNGTTPTALCHG